MFDGYFLCHMRKHHTRHENIAFVLFELIMLLCYFHDSCSIFLYHTQSHPILYNWSNYHVLMTDLQPNTKVFSSLLTLCLLPFLNALYTVKF